MQCTACAQCGGEDITTRDCAYASNELHEPFVSSRGALSGGLLIAYDSQLWSVCDDMFDDHGAEVACRNMGCGSGIFVYDSWSSGWSDHQFGIGLDNVECVGDEENCESHT